MYRKVTLIDADEWDAVLLAVDLRDRFVATHARLSQAVLILSHRDRAFPLSVDVALDDALHEVEAALTRLEGAEEWPLERAQRQQYGQSVEMRDRRKETSSPPLILVETTEVPLNERRDGWQNRKLRETMALSALGYAAPEISRILDISYNTVKTRLANGFRAFTVRNQAQLVDRAWRDGIMTSPETLEFQEPHRRLRGTPKYPLIPPRRREVLALIASGHQYSEIGEALGIHTSTAKRHAMMLFADFGLVGATNATELVNVAWERGILRAD